MTTLVEWLQAQLDADQAIAEKAAEKAPAPWRSIGGHVRHSGPEDRYKDHGLWDNEGTTGMDHPLCMEDEAADHVALHDPASVLADIAAKRQILDQHRFYLAGGQREQMCQTCGGEGVMSAISWPCNTLRLLASAYAHRDGFDLEWAQLDPVDLW